MKAGITVNDFVHEPGKNDAEYIALLEEALKRQKEIVNKAIAKIKQSKPCEDAVSRNAIIQKLNTMDRYVSEELILCDTDKKFPKNEVFIVDDVYEEIVENLPPAQPESNCIGCKHIGMWEDEVEYGYPSPCTRCKRRVNDNYEQ